MTPENNSRTNPSIKTDSKYKIPVQIRSLVGAILFAWLGSLVVGASSESFLPPTDHEQGDPSQNTRSLQSPKELLARIQENLKVIQEEELRLRSSEALRNILNEIEREKASLSGKLKSFSECPTEECRLEAKSTWQMYFSSHYRQLYRETEQSRFLIFSHFSEANRLLHRLSAAETASSIPLDTSFLAEEYRALLASCLEHLFGFGIDLTAHDGTTPLLLAKGFLLADTPEESERLYLKIKNALM